MTHYACLIVGGGMTADAAVRGIRQVDSHGSIGLMSAEKHPPYNRPPLSKQLWKGKPLDGIWQSPTAKALFITCKKDASAVCCCGMCGSK